MTETVAAAYLGAMGNPVRLRIFHLLVRAGPAGLSVGTIRDYLDIPASTLTHHLAALAKADLMIQDKQGREIRCTANFDAMQGLVNYLSAHCCAGFDEPAT